MRASVLGTGIGEAALLEKPPVTTALCDTVPAFELYEYLTNMEIRQHRRSVSDRIMSYFSTWRYPVMKSLSMRRYALDLC